MNPPITRAACLATLLVLAPLAAHAQNIYKCTVHGQLTFTDQPCPAGTGGLLHQADDVETIDYYLRLGQDKQAAAWAKARHLDALYQQRVALRDAREKAQAEQAQQQALAAQQQAAQDRDLAMQQAAQARLNAQSAQSAQLQAENANLRAQNARYQAALDQPVYAPVYAYPTRPRPYAGHETGDGHGHGHEHRPPPVSDQPQFKTCVNKAGGRVDC